MLYLHQICTSEVYVGLEQLRNRGLNRDPT